MSVYPFIEAEQAERQGTVKRSCELLEVSRAAYYDWSQPTPSRRRVADEELAGRIQRIYDESGAPTAGPGCARRFAARACA